MKNVIIWTQSSQNKGANKCVWCWACSMLSKQRGQGGEVGLWGKVHTQLWKRTRVALCWLRSYSNGDVVIMVINHHVCINTKWALWCHICHCRSRSTMDQLMAWCHQTQSHYLIHCDKISRITSEINFRTNAFAINHKIFFFNHIYFRMTIITLPGWLMSHHSGIPICISLKPFLGSITEIQHWSLTQPTKALSDGK